MTDTTPSSLFLPGLPQGFSVLAYEELGSTNDTARQLAQEGATHGTVVTARRQTAGRGRQGRQWSSQDGNLFCSILLRPDCDLADAANLSFVAALAVRDALALLSGQQLKPQLKWPNDILVNGAKASGLLLESALQPGSAERARAEFVILGIGVNLQHSPDEMLYPATSLARATEGTVIVPPDQALVSLLTTFEQWYLCWQQMGFLAIRESWLDHARGVGQQIRVSLPHEEMTGRFEGLDSSGALLLRTETDELVTVTAGDVFFG
ncbi:biotin--[acetyl-CoA-carboxylase] ligase [Kiloniella sp. b19]|uniref:biotin--[acetyl-CoA-carboxylase] ligase n=1 Tax=Kiloniella sp. GXU_MW_B19 TaxID=3141326 RepID=UPI0031D869B9